MHFIDSITVIVIVVDAVVRRQLLIADRQSELDLSLITMSCSKTGNSRRLPRPFRQHFFAAAAAEVRLKSTSEAGFAAVQERGALATYRRLPRIRGDRRRPLPADDRLSIATRSGRKSRCISTSDRYLVASDDRSAWSVGGGDAGVATTQLRAPAPRPEMLDLRRPPRSLLRCRRSFPRFSAFRPRSPETKLITL